MDLDFLRSRRFWALVIVAVLGVLKANNILSDEITNALIVIVGGFIGIRTVDRLGEKIGK